MNMPLWYQGIRRPLAYVQTVAGVSVFAYTQPRREGFWLRLLLCGGASWLLCYWDAKLFYPAAVLTFWDSLSRMSTQLVQYLAVFLTVWCCYRVTHWSALMLTSAGYCAQTIAGGVKSLLLLLPNLGNLLQGPGMFLLDLVAYLGSYGILYLSFRPAVQRAGEADDRAKAVFSLVVLFMSVLTGRLNQDVQQITAVTAAAQAVFSLLTAVLVLIIQFGAMERTRLEQDVDAMRELVHEQHEQFRHSKQSVELVNEKYHDLKSLLEGFRGDISPEQIQALRDRVGEYDTHVETGNHVLDIVLSEKRAICAARHIVFTSYAEGKALDFLEELDLYALVGNALNNAIDAVSKLPEPERHITLTLHGGNGQLSLHVENPYAGAVVMENALPQSQRDRRYHGFGMHSMERICEKYHGALAVQAEDNLFTLDALLFAP